MNYRIPFLPVSLTKHRKEWRSMLKMIQNISLQTKITSLVIGIMTILICGLLSFFAYFDIQQVYEHRKNLSLQTAKTLSFVPDIQEAIITKDSNELQYLIHRFSHLKEGMFVVIQNRDGEIVAHPDEKLIGSHQPFIDGYMAIVFGGYYTMESSEFVGPAIVGKAPVYNKEATQIIGVVTVGYLKSEIKQVIFQRLNNILFFTVFIVLLGILFSYMLARHIRNETLGLEPREIAALYRSRVSILSSINEGVIATDENGKVTLVNQSAKELLNLSEEHQNLMIDAILPDVDIKQMMIDKQPIVNKEIHLNHKNIIINSVPILNHDQFVGTVTTFRDKTQIMELLSTLSDVKKYSDDLRAQTHEFSNKLHVIAGLIQLKKYEEVQKLIDDEVKKNAQYNRLIFEQIKDHKIQAVLLGKISKASEKKVDFMIDPNSSLDELPEHINLSYIITIIGNLIDNALDAVLERPDPKVTFFTVDFGDDIIFEIADNGPGIQAEEIELIFEPGYSTKPQHTENRGFGLYNVKEAVQALNGSLEVKSDQSGTTVTVYIPKKRKKNGE